jgi:hypothetical protein
MTRSTGMPTGKSTLASTAVTRTCTPPPYTVYLSGAETPRMRAGLEQREDLGLLLQPRSHLEDSAMNYRFWAADNGCFAQGDRFDAVAWLAWVAQLPRSHRCVFVVAPDVLGDAAATLTRSAPYLEAIRELGFPAALVAQDGLEHLRMAWDSFDALFIGGSTEWKLSQAAFELAAEARERGKWTHLGRVNSRRRLLLGTENGIHSADGTYLAFGPLKNEPKLRGWLDEVNAGRLTVPAPWAA